ncbi:MAG: ECF transporter S component [Acholeplasmataceae bacterium]|jgi:uncharacterized membrane protein|nr:ECF transporter S component [Acholeplasmataceae bacterium]
MKRNKHPLQDMIFASLMIAMGIVLPFLSGNNQELGSMLLLMHIPVILAGFLLGSYYGLLIGIITPILRSLLIGMPPLFPIATSMMFELGAYGFFTGLFYHYLSNKKINIYLSLVLALILGRFVWGGAAFIFYPAAGLTFTFQTYLQAAFVTALPGIAIQLVLIPAIFFALKRTQLVID